MAQYPIPQFIESEGKIIFFLTFRQFFLLVGGGAICLVLYFTLPLLFSFIGSAFIILVTCIIAFLKIDNESVVKVVLHFIGFSIAKKNYVWRKKEFSYQPDIQDSRIAKEEKLEFKNTKKSVPLNTQASRLKEAKKMIELQK